MKILTEDAKLICGHSLGTVAISASQNTMKISDRNVLVEPDPVGKTIAGCPNVGIGIKPCTGTLQVQRGYCDFLRVNGRRVCLDNLEGLTDGTPPGTVRYSVATPGQNYVEVL